jgi:hypothetical protein
MEFTRIVTNKIKGKMIVRFKLISGFVKIRANSCRFVAPVI